VVRGHAQQLKEHIGTPGLFLRIDLGADATVAARRDAASGSLTPALRTIAGERLAMTVVLADSRVITNLAPLAQVGPGS